MLLMAHIVHSQVGQQFLLQALEDNSGTPALATGITAEVRTAIGAGTSLMVHLVSFEAHNYIRLWYY